jgi:hypothetical protein
VKDPVEGSLGAMDSPFVRNCYFFQYEPAHSLR